MYKFLFIFIVTTLITLHQGTQVSAAQNIKIILASEVNWEPLNPARGEKSPKAGTLWGDRKGAVPTGFLAKFKDGFSSPPHIHNTTYRAVVISGLIHNDDPAAAHMWMPVGSFWTQPKGEVHITAAKRSSNIALVEIDKGPYLVKPTEEAFDSGERPINVHASNIVWLDLPSVSESHNSPKIAYLWGQLVENESNGTFVKLPTGFKGKIHSKGKTFHAVLISGQLQHQKAGNKILNSGSYFSSKGDAVHKVTSNIETVIYVRTNGKFKITEN
jgi:hypothetical protein